MIDRIEYNELLDKIEKLENKKDYFVEELEEELEELKERLDRLEYEQKYSGIAAGFSNGFARKGYW